MAAGFSSVFHLSVVSLDKSGTCLGSSFDNIGRAERAGLVMVTSIAPSLPLLQRRWCLATSTSPPQWAPGQHLLLSRTRHLPTGYASQFCHQSWGIRRSDHPSCRLALSREDTSLPWCMQTWMPRRYLRTGTNSAGRRLRPRGGDTTTESQLPACGSFKEAILAISQAIPPSVIRRRRRVWLSFRLALI